jgi:hypothetical protein
MVAFTYVESNESNPSEKSTPKDRKGTTYGLPGERVAFLRRHKRGASGKRTKIERLDSLTIIMLDACAMHADDDDAIKGCYTTLYRRKITVRR